MLIPPGKNIILNQHKPCTLPFVFRDDGMSDSKLDRVAFGISDDALIATISRSTRFTQN